MSKRMGFIVNSDKCIGCHSCEMACKNFNLLDPQIRWRKVYKIQEDAYGSPTRMSMSLACNHCEHPQCLKVCPVDAYTKREDGIVIHNDDICIGCKMCTKACPYQVPQYNVEKKIVQKCHMCYERQDQGLKPACVASCPVGAIDVVDLNELSDEGYEKELPGFPDPSITNPSVRFVKPSVVKSYRAQ
ncbi:4Fe-4S dicluster domain-containing protein [Neobacillus sp. PS3-12]|uniref:4Fe-4S dicluster domain-containing protein n=1 Tax=Neobacillus sp. PS3-12 TaxID=3070677 RepID=UPI0027E1A9A5|nr:4Fe-4S dicluster domain-containing protein [Neobacillus sp. PS3-12]WML54438.1 4Fe-4S dicluster domain-containing protein [Neobacillus sp. PS3-12]